MRVVILEPDASGHRLTYVRLIVQALAQLPVEVTLATTRKAVESVEFSQQIKPLTPKLTIAPICIPGAGVLGSAIARWRSLRRVLRELRPDHLYIPYVDGLAQVMGIASLVGWTPRRHACEIEALLMRGGFAYPHPTRCAWIQAQLSIRAALLAPLARLNLIDPIVFDRVRQTFPRQTARLSLLPDSVEPIVDIGKVEARRRLGIPVDGRIISCSGLLDRRKGVDLLIRAFLEASLSQNVRLLLVGRTTPPIATLLQTEANRFVSERWIVVIDRYVTDEELGWANTASDVVCTPYPRHIGSASIVIRAAAAGRPVLATDFGWSAKIVPQFNLGWLCNPCDRQSFSSQLSTSIALAGDWKPTTATQRFVSFNTVQNFQAHWSMHLRQRLELPRSSELIQWASIDAAPA